MAAADRNIIDNMSDPGRDTDPELIFGEPGAVWENDTGKVRYQFVASLKNTCGICLQYHLAIGPHWPIPLHPNCRCRQIAVAPGKSAPEPFVNYVKVLKAMPPDQQAAAMGMSAWRLVRVGVVQWNDVVLPGRIRSLAEVVRLNKLTVPQMVKAGVRPHIARTAAERAARLPTAAAEHEAEHRRELMERVKAAAAAHLPTFTAMARAIRRKASDVLAKVTGRPSHAARLAEAMRRATITRVAMAPAPTRPAPPSKATVRVTEGDYPAASRSIVGRVLTDRELADLAGMADGQLRVVVADRPGGPEIILAGDAGKYAVNRSLRRDPEGRLVLKANAFTVEPGSRRRGIGAEVFGRMADQARRLGVDRITCHAARSRDEAGYAVWPRFGYDGPLPPAVRAQLPADLAGSARVSDLMATPRGTAWWKTNGTTIDLAFDLAPGSLSRRIWDAYLAAKGPR